MSQLLATFVYNSGGNDLHYTVRGNDLVVLDVTGATAILLTAVRRTSAGDASFTKAGTIYGAGTNGTFNFEDIGLAATEPTDRRGTEVYECRITYTKSAETYSSDPFLIAITRFP